MQRHHLAQKDQISPAHDAIALAGSGEEEPPQSCQPQHGAGGIHDEHLLRQKLPGWKHHVLVHPADIAQIFQGGKVVLDLPDDVRQKQQPGKRRGQPYPATREEAARGREQQRGKNGGAKEERGVFVLQAQPSKGAKQQPPAWLVALDGQHHAIKAGRPQ